MLTILTMFTKYLTFKFNLLCVLKFAGYILKTQLFVA